MADATLQRIPLNKIRENPAALRAVNRQSEEYLGLMDSIKTNGVFNAILVREIRDPDSGDVLYGLVDGLHRFTASMDAGKTDIPAQVMSMDDAKALESQIIGNIHKVDTRPVEYSKGLQRLLAGNPLMTLAELASKLSKTSQWLSERFNLLKLEGEIASLVDEGKINLSNAYALAKLPPDEQKNFVERAMTMSPAEFAPTALARKKELDAARRQGRDASPAEFIPVAIVQKKSEIEAEMKNPQAVAILIRENNITDPFEAAKMALKWTLHLDDKSVQLAKAKDEARKKEIEDRKAKAKADREAKKQQEAATTQATVNA